MKKVLLVFGTRPEAVKMAPLIKALAAHPERFDTKICVTAQHRHMLDQILACFDIAVDHDLDIMTSAQDLHDVTADVVTGMRPVLDKVRPDLVLVQGDTTTTFAASLAAFYRKIPVGHVEAGLRTGDVHAPYPEEMNRRLTTSLAHFHFAPTPLNRDNLLAEGVDADRIVVIGNTVIDALLMIVERIARDPGRERVLVDSLADAGYVVGSGGVRRMLLVTGHRRESFGEGFANICEALRDIATANPGLDIVYPVHLNPNVREPVNRVLSGLANVYLVEPLDYESFVYLMSRAYLILTDSGGIQEEAPALGKPTLVMRAVTERPEALEAGTAVLVGTDRARIVERTQALLTDAGLYRRMANTRNPYGDGTAAEQIVAFLSERL